MQNIKPVRFQKRSITPGVINIMTKWEKAINTLKENVLKNRKGIKLAIETNEVNLLLKTEKLNHRVSLEVENFYLL